MSFLFLGTVSIRNGPKIIPVHRNLVTVRNRATNKNGKAFAHLSDNQSVFALSKFEKNLTMVVNKSSRLIQMSVTSIQPGKLFPHGSRPREVLT